MNLKQVFILQFVLTVAFCQTWELYWSDDFDGGNIDLTKWEHEVTAWGGGNGEFQVYTTAPENSFVQDGKLFIRPTLLEDNINPSTGQPFGQDFLQNGVLDLASLYGYCTNDADNSGCYREGQDIPPIASARLRSNGKFAFRYGRVEIRAKMPVGDWLWPAMWFLPEQWCYGGWPTSGEMDLTESVANEDLMWPDGNPHGIQRMASTMHWGIDWQQNRYYLTGNHNDNRDNHYGNMHDYAMEWTPTQLDFFVDGTLVLSIPVTSPEWTNFYDYGAPWNPPANNPWQRNHHEPLAPFDCQFHFLLNIAVGGTNWFISDDAINRGGDPNYAKPWRNGMSQREGMQLFYNGRGADESSGWLWTWTKERTTDNDAMQVEYVRVFKRSDLPAETDQCP